MKKSLKVTSLALAMSMVLGYGIVASAEETTEEIPTPDISKTVKANDDGTYDVEFSVKGSVSTETSTKYTTSDVVLIADHSGSMSWSTTSSDPNITSRWDSLKNAVNVLSDKILYDGTNNNVSVVLFDSYVENISFGESYWTSSADELKTAFDNASYPLGGTYCAPAIDTASSLLADGRDSAKKYVIFLSDGDPHDWNASVTAAENLKSSYPDATLYTVGIPTCNETFMKEVAGDENNYFYAEDADELAKVFDGIADVIKSGYSNVVISDTLSEYVDYVDYDEEGNPIFDIEVYDNEGNVVNGAVYQGSYDKETKKLTLNLGADMLPDQHTYKLSYKVKPNEYADEVYAQNGYNAVGDENTDAEGNATSAGKDGFAVGSTEISFTYRDVDYTDSFAVPVVQVEEKEESSQESSEPSEPESSEPESQPEPSQPESSQPQSQGKEAPQTGSTQNIIFMLAGLAALSVVVSVKAFKAKKSK